MIYLLAIIAILIAFLAMYTDIRGRTITNKLNLVGFCLILCVLGYGHYNGITVTDYYWSGLSSIVLMIALFYTRIIGGGDAKLLMVLGFSIPVASLFQYWFFVALCGGLISLVYIAWKQKLHQSIPYGIAIFGGTVLFWANYFYV